MASSDTFLTPNHPAYPIGARAMARPPNQLLLRGALPSGRAVAIVGTRRATAPALHFARSLAEAVCDAGWSVWSGGAAGIDTAAHEGAIKAHGQTVVVMGTGFEHLYPAENRGLFSQVLNTGGAWLSPYAPEQRGTKWTFLPRNELLASLVDDVVIVQAPARSGARSTVAAARRMGKTVWAVPSSPWDNTGCGCLAEIESGARVLTRISHLVERCARSHTQRAPSLTASLTAQEHAVAAALRQGPACLDVICDRSGLAIPEANTAALTLTLKRVLLQGADGAYHLVR